MKGDPIGLGLLGLLVLCAYVDTPAKKTVTPLPRRYIRSDHAQVRKDFEKKFKRVANKARAQFTEITNQVIYQEISIYDAEVMLRDIHKSLPFWG